MFNTQWFYDLLFQVRNLPDSESTYFRQWLSVWNEMEGLSLYTNRHLLKNAPNRRQAPMNDQGFSTNLSLGSHHSKGELLTLAVSIDEIAMWNKMLTQQEINELHESYTSSQREV